MHWLIKGRREGTLRWRNSSECGNQSLRLSLPSPHFDCISEFLLVNQEQEFGFIQVLPQLLFFLMHH